MKTNFWAASERHETHAFEDVFIVGLCESFKGKIMRWIKADIFKQRKSTRQNSALSAPQMAYTHSEKLIWPFRPSLLLWSHILKTFPASKFLADTGPVPLYEVLEEECREEIQRKSRITTKKKLAIWLGGVRSTLPPAQHSRSLS